MNLTRKTKNKKEEYLLENIVDDMAQQEVWKIKFDTSVIIYGIDLFFIFLCIYLIIFLFLKNRRTFFVKSTLVIQLAPHSVSNEDVKDSYPHSH